MKMNETMTPAQELRAATEKIRESSKPIVTHRGADIGGVVEDWFKAVADEWAALERHNTKTSAGIDYPDDPDDAWLPALQLARLINDAPDVDDPASKCEAPQSDGCPNPPTHIAEYYSGKVMLVGDEPSPLMRRIPVCGGCVNDVPGLHRVRLAGGAR